jgi:uncharacterized protein YdeI (YjbR/CyaY-like superfamily)
VPPDLEAAFDKNKEARSNYESFPKYVKKQTLWLVISAKRPETRAKRIEKIIEKTKKNERPF